jgi:hypothetical protein
MVYLVYYESEYGCKIKNILKNEKEYEEYYSKLVGKAILERYYLSWILFAEIYNNNVKLIIEDEYEVCDCEYYCDLDINFELIEYLNEKFPWFMKFDNVIFRLKNIKVGINYFQKEFKEDILEYVMGNEKEYKKALDWCLESYDLNIVKYENKHMWPD